MQQKRQLLYSGSAPGKYAPKIIMALVFVISTDWALRSPVRAQLREAGMDARGMSASDDLGRAFGAGDVPDAIVLDATAEFLADSRVGDLVQRISSVLVASRTSDTLIPQAPSIAVLYRPVRVAEIVVAVKELLNRQHSSN